MTRHGVVPSSTRQRADLLDSTHWANNLSGKQVALLAGYMLLERHPEGAILFRQGDRESSLGILVEGKLVVEKSGRGESQTRLAVLGAGKSFGEMALLDGEPRSATARVQEPVSLLVLTPEAFEQLCYEKPGLAVPLVLRLAKMMSQRLRLTSSRLVDHLEINES